jgi:hypothetical protein
LDVNVCLMLFGLLDVNVCLMLFGLLDVNVCLAVWAVGCQCMFGCLGCWMSMYV